jgi:hypothetical protein
MVRIQCTAEECAGVFECSVDTLDRRLKEEGYGGFADFYKKHSDEGKASLRRAQWKAAQDGNPTMLVWLGKQMLGQRDKHDLDHTSSDGSMTPKGVPDDLISALDAIAGKIAGRDSAS